MNFSISFFLSMLFAAFAGAQPLRCSQSHLRDFDKIEQTIESLATLRLRLDQAQAQGESSILVTAMKSNYQSKEKAFIATMEANQIMSREQYFAKLRAKIVNLQSGIELLKLEEKKSKEEEEQLRHEHQEKIQNAEIDGTKAIFHRIEPGSFKMGLVGSQVDVTLTKAFDMMATPMTQIIWKTVIELAQKKFPGLFLLKLNPSRFQGERNPVEQVSYDDVQNFISALNSISLAGEPALDLLIPGHRQGDLYRLPTSAEWEFVAKGRGQLNDPFRFGPDSPKLRDYAWFDENSKHQTHPVAEKLSLKFEGKNFFDMYGNVFEWTQDRWDGRSPLRSGTDPLGTNASDRVVYGGSWYNDRPSLRPGFRSAVDPYLRSPGLGFRLVRIVP